MKALFFVSFKAIIQLFNWNSGKLCLDNKYISNINSFFKNIHS